MEDNKYITYPNRYLDDEMIERVERLSQSFDPKCDITFAIGDIHGKSDYLIRLLEYITQERNQVFARFVFLGDYVDRGPDSSGVICIIRLMQEIFGSENVIALRGNHEQMMLNELNMNNGRMHVGSTSNSFNYNIPMDIWDWMDDLPFYWQDDLHIYVHAGLIPGKKLEKQAKSTLIWVREEFLHSDFYFGKHVFHGHTPKSPFEITRYRTNLDTGACFGGQLSSAKILKDKEIPVEIFQVTEDKTFNIKIDVK